MLWIKIPNICTLLLGYQNVEGAPLHTYGFNLCKTKQEQSSAHLFFTALLR